MFVIYARQHDRGAILNGNTIAESQGGGGECFFPSIFKGLLPPH